MSSADHVDEEMVAYSLLPFFILGILRLVLACFGILGNVISIRVLVHRTIWSATSILLISLVIYDTIFLFTGAVVILAGLPENEETHLFVIMTVVYPFRYIAQMGSGYSTVAVTIERFIVVVWPLRARSIWTINNARRVAIAIFVFSLGFNVPRSMVFHRLSSEAFLENATVPQSNSTNNFVYTRVYEVYLTVLVFYILPYTIILILNIQLIVRLRMIARKTKQLSTRNGNHITSPTDKEDGLTVIVLGITACFVVCCVIPLVYHMILLTDLDMLSRRDIEYLSAVGDVMLSINAATDFVFYCLLGRRFRSVFFQLFCPPRFSRRNRDRYHFHTIEAKDTSHTPDHTLSLDDEM